MRIWIKNKNKGKLFIFLASFIAMFFCLGATKVLAVAPEVTVRDEGYAARYVSQSIADPVVIEQGQTKTVSFTFKNVGTATWQSPGSRHISAYTMEPRYHNSDFKGSNWISANQTASVSGTIHPGETGTLELQLTANKESGEYIEKFYLAAENHTWMKGGYFYVKIKIVDKLASTQVDKLVDTKEDNIAVDSYAYKGKKIGINSSSFTVRGGDKVKVVVIYQNTGEATWKKYELLSSNVSLASTDSSVSLADSSWKSATLITEKQAEVLPSGSFREIFYFRAPENKGIYTANFKVKADDRLLDDTVTINVHVTENAPVGYKPPSFSDGSISTSDTVIIPDIPRLKEEPRIRVGLQSSDDIQEKALQFVSYGDDYKVFNGESFVGTLGKSKVAVMQYAGGVYSLKGGGLSFRTNNYIRLEPKNDPHTVFTLMNFDRSMSWAGSGKFNTYRGAVEYRKGQNDGQMYAINDVLLEDYVAGIRETGTGAPLEMIKANLIAARTYAYLGKGKYPYFDMLASTYDQLYLGEGSESIGNVAQATQATRGVMVTYNNEIVTTPYFGNSSGYTKSWASVWGGSSKPWLVPVKCEYDLRDGKRQYGHGVGMSQRDAAYRAEDGADFIEILKHYYTGVELEEIYK